MDEIKIIKNCTFLRTKGFNNKNRYYICGQIVENEKPRNITTSEIIGISKDKTKIKTTHSIYKIEI
jgi:hypothetical protein